MKKVGFPTLLLLVICSFNLYAGPTVIRDNRVSDIATTPVLGRGYSIGTNTYQSTCLKEVIITEPSYDMEYTFTSIEDTVKTSKKTEEEKKKDTSGSSNVKVKVFRHSGSNGLNWALSTGSKTTTINNETYYNHRVLVTIDLYTYYASVDESKSLMSDTARMLLVNNDLPGFFNSCGAYYVRSIGRKANFVSIFTYSTKEEKSDQKFESQMKSAIQSFSTYSYKSLFGGVKVDADLKTATTNELKRMEEFSREASSKHLSIVTHAYGLGKDEKASLISYDLESFKAAIKDAFISMQNPNTGKVATVEIVPWVENTEFQSVVKLDEKEVAVEEGSEGEKETQLLYEKKHILTQNAEFLIEVERADRNMMNMYYKAKLCRANIDANWKKDGKIMEEYENANVVNNRTGDTDTLKKLDETLSDAKIQQLLDNEKSFMYGKSSGGSKNGEGGASICIRAVMKSGFFKQSYRDISECQPIIGKLGDVQSDFVSDYCMPVLSQE